VNGTPVVSAAGAAGNTLVTATATCPAGKVLLGGGGRVSTTDPTIAKAAMPQSYPSSTTTWTAVGLVQLSLSAGDTMTVTAYALCSL
jgi:hypothetical protein